MEEIKDQTSEETLKETSEETAKVPEGFVPVSKFAASQTEALRLKKENEELKKSRETAVIPDDEKRIREVLLKAKQEEESQKKLEDEKLEKELLDLETIYGKYDRDKLLKVVDRYGIYNDAGDTDWDKAMELYNKLDEIPTSPAKKIPIPTREGSQAVEVDVKPEVSSKNMHQLVQEGLRKLGIKE